MPQTQVRVYRKASGEVPLVDWLKKLQKMDERAWAKCVDCILCLEKFGYELSEPRSKPLREGIYELRAKVGTVNYRMLYFFSGKNFAVVSHGFTKEKKVPPKEIDEAVKRKRQVQRDPKTYTAEF